MEKLALLGYEYQFYSRNAPTMVRDSPVSRMGRVVLISQFQHNGEIDPVSNGITRVSANPYGL